MVRNVVKLIVIRKTRVKSRRGQTWSVFAIPEVAVYFGLLLNKSTVGVAESEKRIAAIFLLPVWPLEPPERSVLSPYCISTARNAFYKNTGCAKSQSWPGSTIEKPEVLSKVPEMVRNVVKLIVNRKTRVKSRRGQTWSVFAKPEVVVYFGLLWC